jgi:hypothetical protein
MWNAGAWHSIAAIHHGPDWEGKIPMKIASLVTVVLCASLSLSGAAAAETLAGVTIAAREPAARVNCSKDYGASIATCKRIPCSALYRSFLGTWSGEFRAYVRSQSTDKENVYRPYHEVVSYAPSDCLWNLKTHDSFIVGHQTETYPAFNGLPAKVERNLLITGRQANGTPFLRVTAGGHTYDYELRYKNSAAQLTVWELALPANRGQPQMTFTTVDGRDFAAPADTRSVTVTLTVGPPAAPYWRGVIAYGSHTRNATSAPVSNATPRRRAHARTLRSGPARTVRAAPAGRLSDPATKMARGGP